MNEPGLVVFAKLRRTYSLCVSTIRQEIWSILSSLKSEGQAILVIDKNVAALKRLADRHCFIEKGRVAWSGTTAELNAAADIEQRYLGV